MFVQSHIPGILLLLPALPTSSYAPTMQSGQIKKLKARGDVEVSFWWKKSVVQKLKLSFLSFHPWLRGMIEISSDNLISKNAANNNNNNNTVNINSLNSFSESGFVTMKPMKKGDVRDNNSSRIIYQIIAPQISRFSSLNIQQDSTFSSSSSDNNAINQQKKSPCAFIESSHQLESHELISATLDYKTYWSTSIVIANFPCVFNLHTTGYFTG